VYANFREEDAGEREKREGRGERGWNDGRTSGGRDERSSRRAQMRTRVRGCIDTSLRRWFVIL